MKKKKPEVTSARVARLAGKWLQEIQNPWWQMQFFDSELAELKAIFASALTQAKDKKKRKAA